MFLGLAVGQNLVDRVLSIKEAQLEAAEQAARDQKADLAAEQAKMFYEQAKSQFSLLHGAVKDKSNYKVVKIEGDNIVIIPKKEWSQMAY